MLVKRLFVFCLIFSLSGCTTTDPYTGEKKFSNTGVSSFVGAVGGALAGAAVSGGKTEGALIGASVGAVGGAVVGSSWDRQEAELRRQLRNSGVSVRRTKRGIELVMPGDITFKKASSKISPNFYDVLDSITKVLIEYSDTLLHIYGYASSEGNIAFNQELSEKRAASIAGYFRTSGVNSKRLIDKGFGIRSPIASNKTADGRAKNRRVTISITELK